MCFAHEGEMLPSRPGTTRHIRGTGGRQKSPPYWRAAGRQHEMAEGRWGLGVPARWRGEEGSVAEF